MANKRILPYLVLLVIVAAIAYLLVNRSVDSPLIDSTDPPNVILIIVDTFRADYLNAIGNRGNETPYMDKLANRGVAFSSCITAESVTGPSIAAIMTGKYPSRTGIQYNLQEIPPEHDTMAEQFLKNGYETVGFIAASIISGKYGFNRGFKYYNENFTDHSSLSNDTRNAWDVNQDVISWMKEYDGKKPYFMFIHYFDPHSPYCTHSRTEENSCFSHEYLYKLSSDADQELIQGQIIDIIGNYTEEVNYTDYHIGRILMEVEAMGDLENTVVVLTADHGEELFQHDSFYGHGRSLYNTVANVPLIISFPDKQYAGTKTAATVRTIDIFPSIMEIAGIEPPGDIQGKSLLPLIKGKREKPRYAFTIREPYDVNYWEGNGASVTDWPWRLMVFSQTDDRLFNLDSDFLERENIIEQHPGIAEKLRTVIETGLFNDENYGPPPGPLPTRKEQKILKDLGYIR